MKLDVIYDYITNRWVFVLAGDGVEVRASSALELIERVGDLSSFVHHQLRDVGRFLRFLL